MRSIAERKDSRPPSAVQRGEAPPRRCVKASATKPRRAALAWTAEGGCPYAGDKSLCVCDPVDHVTRIIAQIHRSIAAEYNPDRTPHPPAFLRFAWRQPPCNEIFYAGLWLSFVVEFHAHYFVSRWNAAIPRSVEGHEDVVAILRREHRPFVEREPQRSGVRLHLDLRPGHILAAIVPRLGEVWIGHAIAIAVG